MYDYYFGDKKEINKNEDRYLLSIKRMFPKWINSIPDTEFLALGNIAKSIKKNKPIFVETGSGASSLVLCYYAMKSNGKLYTWDINPEKTSHLRSAFNETIARDLKKDINKHWITINSSSISKYTGLSIIGELKHKINLFFQDSEHVLDTVLGEVNLISSHLDNDSYVCIDDANYRFKSINTGYINIIRKKLGLKKITITNNESYYFYKEVEKYLKNNFKKIIKINDSFKKDYKNDIYFKYFENEFKYTTKFKMHNNNLIKHRFDVWQIKK